MNLIQMTKLVQGAPTATFFLEPNPAKQSSGSILGLWLTAAPQKRARSWEEREGAGDFQSANKSRFKTT